MPEAFWIAAAGFLLSLHPGPELRTPRWTGVLFRRFLESAELFLHLALLLFVFIQSARFFPPEKIRDCFPLYYALGAYTLVLIRGRDGSFFSVSLLLGFSFLGFEAGLRDLLLRAAGLACGSGIFTLLLLCAQRRLVFSKIPAAFQGLTHLFLLAAFLALTFHALEGLFWF